MVASEKQEEQVPTLWEAAVQFMRLVRLIRSYWGRLGKGMLMALVLGLVGMVTPYLTKLLIDEVYPSENVSLMHVLVAGILALGLATALMGAIRGYFSLYVETRLSSATRLLFFNHLQHLKARFFDEHQVGEVNSRFQDVGLALRSISQVFQTVFVQGVYLILVPPVLFLLNWRLALVALISVPLTVTITGLSGRILRRYWKRTSEAYADLNAFQIETLSHIRTFKSMGLENQNYHRARNMIDLAMQHQLRAGGLGQVFGVANGSLRALNTALFTWFGWTLILSHQMTLGDYIAFSAYIGYLYNPISQLVNLFSQFQQSAVHLSRMYEYLDSPVEQDPTLAYAPPQAIRHHLKGQVKIQDVCFSYASDRPVLRELSLELPEGSITAVVGPSGSGKTTLLRLLSSLETPVSGSIAIDGRTLQEIGLGDLRQQMAVVWQDVSLIKGTLWDNLTLGAVRPSTTQLDEIVEVCGLGEVLQELPEGYQTPVAEWGSTLSAGQRQRVAIARALARQTPILLFDEATANLDIQTEAQVLHRIFSYLRGKTVIFVTHRLANALLADRICVLQAGRLVGTGSHQELLDDCELYGEMYGVAREAEARFRILKGSAGH